MKKYQPQDIEQSWYKKWESANYFAPSGNGEPFCIMIPPPNVTGTLHMGHAFQHSLVDSMVRYQRMKGKNTLWQMGTDHAGIATQLLVTEKLAAQNIKPLDIGREAFIDKVWEWKAESGGTISKQLRRLGASLHWETERFTLDEGLSKAVIEVFVRLHEDGLIYRGKRLVNWDPVLRSSISDLEVESTEEKGHLWHFRYPLVDDPSSFLIVATTRPETMLGDAAVAVNPSDERYKHLVGKSVQLPLTDRTIPIIADHYVDMAFGTGCVKITPAHDFNDYDVGRRHDLPLINILTEDAKISDTAPEQYRGMDRFEARDAVVRDLDALGLLDKIEDHLMAVPRGEKSGVVVEPFLSDQWFVDIKPLAEPAIRAVENGEIEFIPKQAENIYFAWMRDIQDWTISRQQWWGHQIPAWYDDNGEVYVGRSEAEVRQKYKLDANTTLNRDPDVLDTWFSSALWTFSTLGWPDKTPELETFHSTDILVTGHDIISFWVSRMIMMTLKFMGEVPFRKVYIHGLVTDADGNKMSKSKGNGLDPMDIIDGISVEDLVAKRTANLMQPKMAARIEKATRKEFPEGIMAYGTDPLRFTFYAMASTSRKVRFDLKRVEGYRNFCNKLWNASNFVISNLEGQTFLPAVNTTLELTPIDLWIRSEFVKTAIAVNLAMETHRWDLVAKAIYEFVWDEFCDWYLELTKPVLNADGYNEATRIGTRNTLATILESVLRLAHPFLPFLTEELWQSVPVGAREPGDTIMLQHFPEGDASRIDDAATEDVEWLKKVVTGVRNIRGEMDISPAKPVPVLFFNASTEDKRRITAFAQLLDFLVRPEKLEVIDGQDKPLAATQLVGEMELLVPMAGIIDKNAELARLDKEIDRKEKDRARTEGKINNPSFVEKAPVEVVDKERGKLVELDSALRRLIEQRTSVASL